jgi:hypothetical protein
MAINFDVSKEFFAISTAVKGCNLTVYLADDDFNFVTLRLREYCLRK